MIKPPASDPHKHIRNLLGRFAAAPDSPGVTPPNPPKRPVAPPARKSVAPPKSGKAR